MNSAILGIRNAFRNKVRSFSIVLILGLSIGLALTMLVARQTVEQKIQSVKASIGNTITISPAGFSGFSSVNNSLTTSELSKVSSLPHIINLQETLTDRLTTIGSSTPSFGGFGGNPSASNTNNQTSLTSPVTIKTGGSGSPGPTQHFFISGGGSIPTNFTPPVSITGTNDTTNLNGTSLTISSGSAVNGSSDANDAMVSKSMASKNNLKIGSTFTAYATTLTVTGIFTVSSNEADAGTVIVSLPTEQRLSNQSGDVTSAIATVDSLDNLNSATTAIKNTLGTSSADVTSAQTEADNTVAPLNSVKTVALYSVIGAVIAGSVIILLTMIMVVRERRREIGVLKAIGASNLRVVEQFMTEAVTLTLMAVVIGLIVGVAASSPITNALVKSSTNSTTTTASAGFPGGGGGFARSGGFGGGGGGFASRFGATRGISRSITNLHAVVSWSILAYGIGAAILIAAVGSCFAAWLVVKVRPSEVMRTE